MLSKNENNTREIANYLLNHCFIVGSQDKDRYNYVASNKDEFDKIFQPLGYEVKNHPIYKVIQLRNLYSGKLNLLKYESIFLLIFRLIYANKIENLNFKGDEVVVTVREVKEEFDKLQCTQKFDRKFFEEGIKVIKPFNIIQTNGKLTSMDSQIKILPSIRMTMPDPKITSIYEQTLDYLNKFKKQGGNDDEQDDNIDRRYDNDE